MLFVSYGVRSEIANSSCRPIIPQFRHVKIVNCGVYFGKLRCFARSEIVAGIFSHVVIKYEEYVEKNIPADYVLIIMIHCAGPSTSPQWSPSSPWPGEPLSPWRRPGSLWCGDWGGGWGALRVPLGVECPLSTSGISTTMGGIYLLLLWTRWHSMLPSHSKYGSILHTKESREDFLLSILQAYYS